MRTGKKTERRHQINIRLTASEMLDLERIGLREDRDRSYLVAWFMRWGIIHYEQIGSLLELKIAKLVRASSPSASEIKKFAAQRLAKREEAKENYERISGKGNRRLTKKTA